MRNLLFFTALLMFSQQAFSSHDIGGQISIEHDTLNRYRIRLAYIFECNNIATADTFAVNVSSNSLNSHSSRTLLKTDSMVLYSCTGLPCNNPGANAYQVMIYTDTITLSSPAADWLISTRQCCRPLLSNIRGIPSLYLETTFDNTIVAHNRTPIDYTFNWENKCVNQLQQIDLSVVDLDGDSLDYQVVTALDSTGIPMSYGWPYTATNPLPNISFSLDSSSGILSLNPSSTGSYIIAYVVREYRNNLLLSTTYRDFVINIYGCSFLPPDFYFTLPEVSGINGSTVDTISSCYDVGFNFNINTFDMDNGDSTKIIALLNPPGSTLTANPAQFETGMFNWTTTQADTSSDPYLVLAQVSDRICGITYKMFKLYVKPCTALSVEKIVKDFNTTLYPNPTEGIATLSIKTIKTDTYQMSLYDLAGKLIDDAVFAGSLEAGDHKIDLDLRSQAQGSYLLEIKTDSGKRVIPIQKL